MRLIGDFFVHAASHGGLDGAEGVETADEGRQGRALNHRLCVPYAHFSLFPYATAPHAPSPVVTFYHYRYEYEREQDKTRQVQEGNFGGT